MRRWRAASAAAAALLAGCAARAAPVATVPLGVDPGREAAAVRAVVGAFIAAEARGDEAADTLLAPGAFFINSGITVEARPRLNVVQRPTRDGGAGYLLTGHHELLVPLIVWGVDAALDAR